MAKRNSTPRKGKSRTLPDGFRVVAKCDEWGPHWRALARPKPIGDGFAVVATQVK